MIAARHEFMRYAVASATAFVVDAGLLWAMIRLGALHYLAAATLAFCAGALVAYTLSVRFVFTHRRLESRALELNLFLLIGVISLGLNNLVIWLSVELAGAAPVHAKFAASGITLVVNFALRRLMLFTPRRARITEPVEGTRCLESH